MSITVVGHRFNVGQLVITQGAWNELPQEEVWMSLVRHMDGDWGDVGESDWAQNDGALENGGRLLSRYATRRGIVFWIVTEHHRCLTTILLPAEY